MNKHDTLSLWDYTALEKPPESPRALDTSIDVAIVGGGFTGLSTALHLAQKGVDCCVLEAHQIGYGGSGRNAGLVNAGLWLPPQDAQSRLGSQYGPHFIEVFGQAPDYVFSLIEQHQIQCEAQRNGTIHAAHSKIGLQDLARRAEEWHRLGAPVELLDDKQTAQKIGSHRFFGGLLDRRAGTINPMGYVRGLARAADSAGAKIHTGVKVLKLERNDKTWNLATSRGRFSAKSIVLATNAYTDTLWPGLQRSFTKIHYFQVATEPLGERATNILPDVKGLWDTGRVMFSLRKDSSGRLIIGSMGKIIGGENGVSKYWADKTLRRLFPELGSVQWEKAWHGQIAMTQDHLPHIHRLASGLYTPIGYNGRGITTGTIFGKAMAELLTGMPENQLLLPLSEVKQDRSGFLKSLLYETTFKVYRLYKSL